MIWNRVPRRAMRATQWALVFTLAAALPLSRAHAQLLPSLGLQAGAGYGLTPHPDSELTRG